MSTIVMQLCASSLQVVAQTHQAPVRYRASAQTKSGGKIVVTTCPFCEQEEGRVASVREARHCGVACILDSVLGSTMHLW